MTLYNQAESNTRKTWFLMTIFFLFIIALGWFISYYYNDQSILFFAVAFSIISSIGSYWWSDKVVLAMSKAKEIKHDENPGIYHIVENLCITAGLPLPRIYLINESQPNAFATGRNAKHAVIAVTRGLLEKLDKAELEGVIAHELSHIGNKDMLLQTVVVVMAGFVAILSDWFFRVSFFGGNRRDERSGGNLMAFFGIAAVILAPIAATMIQMAISRKREFLADASGALLTRYPEGLARALEKISADSTPLRTANNSTAHLYISNPFKGKKSQNWLSGLFMTHPPVQERVKALRGMDIK